MNESTIKSPEMKETAGGIKKQVPTLGAQQDPRAGEQLTELCICARNRYESEVGADAAIYKQHRSIEKVNYPWLLTRNKIIKLFPLLIYLRTGDDVTRKEI